MMKKKIKRNGFSILEVLMAIAIISFSIIPIVSMWRYTSQANIKSIYAIHAANLASKKLEHFKFGGTIPPAPGVDAPILGEYKMLKLLLEEASAPSTGTFNPLEPHWKSYDKLEDYGTIPDFPNFKRYTHIAFFPEESPDPSKYPESILSSEYVRMTQRIKIVVKVTWVENLADKGNALKEKSYTLATIVANKE